MKSSSALQKEKNHTWECPLLLILDFLNILPYEGFCGIMFLKYSILLVSRPGLINMDHLTPLWMVQMLVSMAKIGTSPSTFIRYIT